MNKKHSFGCMFATRKLASIAAAVLGLWFASPQARAELVAAQTVTEQSVLLSGTLSSVHSFTVSGPGTLTIQLSNIAWPERLASLNCLAFSAAATIGSLAAAGDLTIDIGSAGTYYARISGTAQGALNLGMYSVRVLFAPAISAVPLPAAWTALLLGLTLFGVAAKRRGRHKIVMYGA